MKVKLIDTFTIAIINFLSEKNKIVYLVPIKKKMIN